MKNLFIILLLIPSLVLADSWDTTDKTLGVTALALEVVDMGQTISISESCHSDHKFMELNPIIGSCPEKHTVYQYFIGSIIAYSIIADALPSTWRKMFLSGDIIVEASSVINNRRVGISIKF